MVLYLDDMIIMDRSVLEAETHLALAMHILAALGFVLNLKKCSRAVTEARVSGIPFILMLNDDLSPKLQIQTIQSLVREIRNQDQVTVLKLLGTLVSTHPAVLPAPLYYRQVEREPRSGG